MAHTNRHKTGGTTQFAVPAVGLQGGKKSKGDHPNRELQALRTRNAKGGLEPRGFKRGGGGNKGLQFAVPDEGLQGGVQPPQFVIPDAGFQGGGTGGPRPIDPTPLPVPPDPTLGGDGDQGLVPDLTFVLPDEGFQGGGTGQGFVPEGFGVVEPDGFVERAIAEGIVGNEPLIAEFMAANQHLLKDGRPLTRMEWVNRMRAVAGTQTVAAGTDSFGVFDGQGNFRRNTTAIPNAGSGTVGSGSGSGGVGSTVGTGVSGGVGGFAVPNVDLSGTTDQEVPLDGVTLPVPSSIPEEVRQQMLELASSQGLPRDVVDQAIASVEQSSKVRERDLIRRRGDEFAGNNFFRSGPARRAIHKIEQESSQALGQNISQIEFGSAQNALQTRALGIQSLLAASDADLRRFVGGSGVEIDRLRFGLERAMAEAQLNILLSSMFGSGDGTGDGTGGVGGPILPGGLPNLPGGGGGGGISGTIGQGGFDFDLPAF